MMRGTTERIWRYLMLRCMYTGWPRPRMVWNTTLLRAAYDTLITLSIALATMTWCIRGKRHEDLSRINKEL
jgi:hypothetical protein